VNKSKDDQYSKAETAQRRDAALRRALSMPPQPHDESNPKRQKRAEWRASGRAK